MEKRKCWLLRPVAWVCTILMMLALQFVAEKLCLLGEDILDWLNTKSLATIVILVFVFGSTLFGLFSYTCLTLPSMLVMLSDKIYPSNHAFRYYFVGIYEIIGCAFLIYAGYVGAVRGGSMFWFYVRYVWLIIAALVMMLSGRSAAMDRHERATNVINS